MTIRNWSRPWPSLDYTVWVILLQFWLRKLQALLFLYLLEDWFFWHYMLKLWTELICQNCNWMYQIIALHEINRKIVPTGYSGLWLLDYWSWLWTPWFQQVADFGWHCRIPCTFSPACAILLMVHCRPSEPCLTSLHLLAIAINCGVKCLSPVQWQGRPAFFLIVRMSVYLLWILLQMYLTI